MAAALGGNPDSLVICRYLIQHGVGVNTTNDDGQTALTYALYSSRGSEGRTPEEVEQQNNKLVQRIDLLPENGAAVNVQDKYGMTALHYAMQYGLGKAKARLIKAGAKPGKQRPIKL